MSILYIFDIIGTYVFAISGAIVGVNKKMDIYGIFILALVTGVGGGTLRDIMLGRIPPFIFNDIGYLTSTILATFTVFFLFSQVNKNLKLLNIFDAIGLGIFTSIGTSIAKQHDIAWFGIILFGVITATVGGMLRDILAKQIPFVLQKDIYASASILGGLIFLLLDYLNIDLDLNIIFTSIIVTLIRLLGINSEWSLPALFKNNNKGDI